MRTTRLWSSRELSAAVCAFTVFFSLGGVHAAADAEAVAAVQRYCTASWRNAGIDPQDWDDCTQNAVMELLESVPSHRWSIAVNDAKSEERRELKRSVWRIVKRWKRCPRIASLNESCVCGCVQEDSDIDEQIEQVDRAACDCLSSRQYQILDLYRQGWSVGEIAEKLSVETARVSDEKYKAIKKLQSHFSA